jgi:hypothetical protein
MRVGGGGWSSTSDEESESDQRQPHDANLLPFNRTSTMHDARMMFAMNDVHCCCSWLGVDPLLTCNGNVDVAA